MPACKPALIALSLFSASAGAGFKYWDVTDTSKTPETLSATGLYTDIAGANKKPLPNAWHFEVNAALWSDDAKKQRWVLLKPGTAIGFRELDDYWDYPDSTVFIKLFALDTVSGDSTTRVNWETRLLINHKEIVDSGLGTVSDHWYGFSYKWNADQKDARLVHADMMGRKDSLRIWPQGRNKPSRYKKWVFPSRYQCDRCHVSRLGSTLHARSVLGFFTAQLNRPHPDSAGINQLEYFFAKKILKGQRPQGWATSPHWYGVADSADPKATLDIRARSYIAANCSGCHGARGNGVGAADHCNLNYDFFTMESQMEFRHHYTSYFGLDDDANPPRYYPKTDLGNNPEGKDSVDIEPALVVPGYPQKSVLLYRQTSRDTAAGSFDGDPRQMPPLASFEVNIPATTMLAKWIKEMPPVRAPNGIRSARAHIPVSGFTIRLGRLELSAETRRAHAPVTMAAVTGMKVELRRISEGIYALPDRLPQGLYLIRIGATSLLRYLP